MLLNAAGANFLLISASFYGLYSLSPSENAYAYTAAAFSLVHGLLGFVRSYMEDQDVCKRSFMISAGINEAIPLPLANMEFYLKSDKSEIAIIHALSLIPLIYDIMIKLGDEWDDSIDVLKDIALFCNIGSCAYLGLHSANGIYDAVAVIALISRFGGSIINRFVCVGGHVETLGTAGIITMMTYALTQGSK